VNVHLASRRWIVGRTISIYSAFTYGGIAGGSRFWGLIDQNYSLPLALGWSSAATFAVAALVLKLPISNRSEAELAPSGGFNASAIALDLKPIAAPSLLRRNVHSLKLGPVSRYHAEAPIRRQPRALFEG